jgi:hypothetical protein
LLADREYDSDAIVEQAQSQNMITVISLRKNPIIQREYNEDLYTLRI